MKKLIPVKPPFSKTSKRFAISVIVLTCILFTHQVEASGKPILPGCYNANVNDSTDEKKVDYIERVYFSGGNKADLTIDIRIAIQQISERPPTTALAKQLTFLADIQDDVEAAEDACDVLDLLAVGLYNIDPMEAKLQGVVLPSKKATAKAGNALENLSKLGSSSTSLSSSASTLAWNDYLLRGGKASAFGSGASKVAGATGKIGSVAGAAGDAGRAIGDAKNVLGAFGLNKPKKDKACKSVSKKDIVIGPHGSDNPVAATDVPPAVSAPLTSAIMTTVISIPGISSGFLRSLTDSIRNKPNIQSAEKSYNETLSTITIVHRGSTDMLADWIEDKFGEKLKLLDYSNGKINVAEKKK